MTAIFLIVNLFCALYVRQLFINRNLKKIILKYYFKYGFLPYDDEIPKIINNMEEEEYCLLSFKSKLNKIKQLFKRK